MLWLEQAALVWFLLTSICGVVFGQSALEGMYVSGNVESHFRVFVRDSLRGAVSIPQYEWLLSGGELWAELRTAYKQLEALARFDGFYNSNLPQPTQAFTSAKVGYWHVRFVRERFSIQVGHIYHQVGSGLLWRTWEERPLGIDNSLVGMKLTVQPFSSLTLVGMGGQLESLFDRYGEFVKSAAVQWQGGTSQWFCRAGAAIVNRTLSQQTMAQIVAEINSYPVERRFVPEHNMYAVGGWLTAGGGPLVVSVEANYRLPDIYRREIGTPLEKAEGWALYGEVQATLPGMWVAVRARQLHRWDLRVNPYTQGLAGVLSYVPAFSRMVGYQLAAYYMPVPQMAGEHALQADVAFPVGEHGGVECSFSWIDALPAGSKLLRTIYMESYLEPAPPLKLTGVLQYLEYNLERYFVKPGKGMAYAWVPAVEAVYRMGKHRSLKTQLQYLATTQDRGSWALGYVEVAISPSLSVYLQDMWNVKPTEGTPLHYLSCGVVFRSDAIYLNVRYAQTREGINCSGGVCRWEPAFNGIVASLTATL